MDDFESLAVDAAHRLRGGLFGNSGGFFLVCPEGASRKPILDCLQELGGYMVIACRSVAEGGQWPPSPFRW